MSTAIKGSNTVDDHLTSLSDDADDLLHRLDKIADRAQEILAGQALGKTAHQYLANQDRANLERAHKVFSELDGRIQRLIRVRQQQSSIFRSKIAEESPPPPTEAEAELGTESLD